MSSKILIKRSTTSGSVPTTSDLDTGELGLNTADKRVYTNNAGTIVELGTYPSSLNVTGNTDLDGTLNVDGVSTLASGTVSGNWTVTGTLTVSTPTNSTDAASKGYVDTAVANVIDSAPDALNTLNELAAALNDDANFATTVTNALATKLPLAGGTMTGDIVLGTNKITTTADPATDNSLTRKSYVDGILGSATAAADSATAAATSATNAANSATSASTSATTATTQATAASSSASAAATSETNAATSATSAANSATAAATSATNAASSETAAASSESAAATSETNAATSASSASTSATSASNSATSAASSATTATTKASEASTSASNASTSETNAATSATNAATSETNAASSASAASSDAASVASLYDQFDDRYLGAKASDPSVDNDGNALVEGALYFDSTNDVTKVYNGSSWDAIQTGVADTAPTRHSIRPSLLLDFANSKTLDPRIDFTRSSTATYYDGKTFAKAEENLLTYSQEFDNAVWSKTAVTITANSTIAPDGTSTADTIQHSSASGQIYQSATGTSNSDTTLSLYFKNSVSGFLRIYCGTAGGNYFGGWVNTSTGAVGSTDTYLGASVTSFTSTSVGNGWYRVVLSGINGSDKSVSAYFTAADNTLTRSTTPVVYIWGAQVEQRSSVTAYTPTTSQPITNYIPVLQTAASGTARFDHDPVTGESKGLLIEEQRTNLATSSADFSNAYWTKVNSSVDVNTIVSPDGNITGTLFESDLTSNRHFFRRGNAVTRTAVYYTYSAYVKKASSRYVGLVCYSGGFSNTSIASFDLDNGTVDSTGSLWESNSASITDVGNGWYRISATVYDPGNSKDDPGIVLLSDSISAGSGAWIFDSYESVYVWGYQIEEGAFPTSYIPTSGSQVTRSNDKASMTGANFSDWYRQDEGTLYADTLAGIGYYPCIFTISNNTNDRISASRNSNSATEQTGYQVYVQSLATGTSTLTSSNYSATKMAFSFATDDIATSFGGDAVSTDASQYIPYVSKLDIGAMWNSTAYLNGHIKKLAYYPARLSNSELQALTED